ncbi:MAG: chemotaxis protein CheA [Vicinamibacterales bacterium]
MDQTRDALCNDIEHRLSRIACDAIVDPSPDAVAAQVESVAADLEAAGVPDAAARIRALAHEPVEQLGVRLEAEWQDWRATDELRGDVEALGGDAELSSMFVAEALDHLGTIEATLLKLEESPDDKTLLNDVFRPFHTVKGNAGALGLVTVQHFAHAVESLLDRCRSGKHQVGSVEIDIVLKSVDLLTALITDIAARSGGASGKNLRAERLALIEALEQLMAAGSSVGRQEPVKPVGEFRLEEQPAAGVQAATPPANAATAPALTSAAVAPGAAVPTSPATVAAPPAPIAAPPTAAQPTGRADATAIDATVKVDTRKLDGLVDMVGELVILQSLIHESPALARVGDERLTRNLAQLRRITTDLQRGAMSMRMVPIRQTFQKMSRLVRDLCRKSGKQVELTLVGEDTELDRKVVEDINDPLMHMIRNSVDHGIESAEKRLAAGKREAGRMWLRAFHQGGSIIIEVADDGGGLNRQRILEKAIAQGLVTPEQKLTDDEIHQLIFKPGFSTAEKVTEISGRGVGMDVVRRNIDALRGRIDIASTPGAGTTISIKLPLTLAILDGLLIASGPERFVIPTFAVRESLRPLPGHVHTIQQVPRLVQVRDRLVPLVWLSDLFQSGSPRIDPTEATVVVIEDDARLVGLVVDRLVGKQEVVVKSLGEAFAGVRGVAGGAILGDGRIGLILDAHGIVTLIDDSEVAAPAA